MPPLSLLHHITSLVLRKEEVDAMAGEYVEYILDLCHHPFHLSSTFAQKSVNDPGRTGQLRTLFRRPPKILEASHLCRLQYLET